MRCFPIWLLVGLVGLAACKGPEEDAEYVCLGTSGPSVGMEIRGPDGNPAAIGTTVVTRDGTSVDTGGASSDLLAGAGERRPGRYQVEISKLGYERIFLRDVMPPGNTLCDYAEPTDIRAVTLRPLPDAPPVRSIMVLPPGVALGPRDTPQFHAVVDAAPGVSRAVHWSSSDTSAATISPTEVLVARCLRVSRDVAITATPAADPQARAEGHVLIYSPTSLPPPEALVEAGAEEARARLRQCLARVRGIGSPA